MNEKKILEKKEWEYYIFENNGHIEVFIPMAKPTPGFDIMYTLSESEKEKYLQIGIKALEERIEDMRMNFSNYKMNSWR